MHGERELGRGAVGVVCRTEFGGEGEHVGGAVCGCDKGSWDGFSEACGGSIWRFVKQR